MASSCSSGADPNEGEAGVSSASLVLWWPSSAGADGHPGSAESVGDGLWVDAVSGGDSGEREPSGVQVGRVSEGLAGPFSTRVVSLDVVTVESGGDGGAMEPVPVGEFVDRCTGAVGGDEFVDAGGAEASLDGV
jgi:hypothetical protein